MYDSPEPLPPGGRVVRASGSGGEVPASDPTTQPVDRYQKGSDLRAASDASVAL